MNTGKSIAGILGNMRDTASSTIAGHINSSIAQQGMDEAAEDQMAVNNKKAEINWKKIPSASAAAASTEALRTAAQG